MKDVHEVVLELGRKEANIETLLAALNTLSSSDSAQEELDYDLKIAGVEWDSFIEVVNAEKVGEIAEKIESLVSSVETGDKDASRETSKEIIELLK